MMSFLELFLDLFGSSSLVGCGNQQQLRMSKRYDVSCEILGRESGKPRPQLQAILKSMRCSVVELASSHVNDLFLHVFRCWPIRKSLGERSLAFELFEPFWSFLIFGFLFGSLQQILVSCCCAKNLRRPDGWKHGCRTVTHTSTCTQCCVSKFPLMFPLSLSLCFTLCLSLTHSVFLWYRTHRTIKKI